MTALARVEKPAAQAFAAPEEVLVHVRFHPNGEVFTIGECPRQLSPQDWFLRLRTMASPYYQVLAGGRGFFRIPLSRFEAIVSAS